MEGGEAGYIGYRAPGDGRNANHTPIGQASGMHAVHEDAKVLPQEAERKAFAFFQKPDVRLWPKNDANKLWGFEVKANEFEDKIYGLTP